jgi:hypothetical protein
MYKCILLMLLVMAVPITAQQPGTPEDNACYPGGEMEGQCDTLWEWECGWYLARWTTNGGYGNASNFFPDWCGSLLPPLPSPAAEGETAEQPATVCFFFTSFGADLSITTPAYLDNSTVYDSTDGSCSGTPQAMLTGVTAPNQAAALAACQSINPGFTTATDLSPVGSPPGYYGCT